MSQKPIKNRTVEQSINGVIDLLKSKNYSNGAIISHQSIYNRLLDYVKSKKTLHKPITREMIDKFLKNNGYPCFYDTTIVNKYHIMIHGQLKKLLQFQMSGIVSIQNHRRHSIPLLECHQHIQDQYIQWRCKTRVLSPITIRDIKFETHRFLCFLADSKIKLENLQPKHITNYFKQRVSLAPRTIADIAQILRKFLGFLVEYGYIERKLLDHIPRIKYPRHPRLPDVWPKKAVKKLLASIDKESPTGKRNYAICLLIVHLGLRVGDIRRLTLDQINWQQATIAIHQQKTQKAINLPFTEIIGNALIDYLKHGRPQSSSRVIFLTHNAPFEPFKESNNLYSIITKYRRKAGVILPRECHEGFHSLRHSLATRLCEADVPLNVIAALLGHASVESTRHYAKVNIKMLRRAALEWKEEGDE